MSVIFAKKLNIGHVLARDLLLSGAARLPAVACCRLTRGLTELAKG